MKETQLLAKIETRRGLRNFQACSLRHLQPLVTRGERNATEDRSRPPSGSSIASAAS